MTCLKNDRTRNVFPALACGALLAGFLVSLSAKAADPYEPNDVASRATDLHALAGGPIDSCLARSALYRVETAAIGGFEQDWYSFKLVAEASLDAFLRVRTDRAIYFELYRGVGTESSPSPGSRMGSHLVRDTSGDPSGYVEIPLSVEVGTDTVWYLRVVPPPFGFGPSDVAHYDFSVSAENRHFHRVETKSGWVIPYYSNETQLLEDARKEDPVVRTVFVQHGNNRNAWDYFEYVYRAAEIDGIEDRVLIVAPSFLTPKDCWSEDEYRWDREGWKHGEDSAIPSGPSAISSYAVLDFLVERGSGERWPSVEKVVFAGHSAGGQLSHRYASATTVPESIAPIPMSFIPANAGSYLWPDPERPVPYSDASQIPTVANLLDFYAGRNAAGGALLLNADCNGDGVINPSEFGGCLESTVGASQIDFTGNELVNANDVAETINCPVRYDDYPLGVVGRHTVPYMARDGDLTILVNFDAWITRYTGRDMTILLGSFDTGTYDDNNQSCRQRVQGRNRFMRGVNYFLHYEAFEPAHGFAIDVVPRVGHDGRRMFQSGPGKHHLFYDGGSLSAPPSCGLGFESALLLPLGTWLRRRWPRAVQS